MNSIQSFAVKFDNNNNVSNDNIVAY